jgi:molybdopterin-guanine dinucleotide biosynthesis protein A
VNLPDASIAGASRKPAAAACDASGFVLAGGQSSRMGRDKALLSFAGRPLIAHALSILREAGFSGSIAGVPPDRSTPAGQVARTNPQANNLREDGLQENGLQRGGSQENGSLSSFAPMVEDSQPGFGPLAGICAALASVGTRYVVFLPVDLPLLPSSLIAYMLHHAEITGLAVTVPAVNGFSQTFPVVLDRSVLPALQNNLDSGQRGCFSALQAAAHSLGQPVASIAVELLVQSGQIAHPLGLAAAHWFLNMNTPHDLHRAEALMAQVIA